MLLDPPVTKPEQLFFNLSDRFRMPAPALTELVYVSRRLASFDETGIVNMVVDAGVRNYLAGVSGRLWYSPMFFLQALEGTSQMVEAFYAKIRADPRHADVTVVGRRKLSVRRFDRPMHLFRGDEDRSFRDFVAGGSPAGEDSFDATCERLCLPVTGGR